MDQYELQNQRIQKLLWKIKDLIGCSVPVDQIASKDFLNDYSGWYLPSLSGFNPWGRIISVDVNLRGRQLFETVAHEVGHSLLNKRRLKQSLKLLFTQNEESGPRLRLKNGFFSAYARTNWEEDFCETFSAWVTNAGRLKSVAFEGRKFDLKNDKVLIAKYNAIKQYLNITRKT